MDASEPTAAATADQGAAHPGNPPLDQRLEPRAVAWWLATEVLRAGVFAAILLFGARFWHEHEPRAWVLPVARGLAAALVVAAIAVPPLAWARWRFGMDDRMLRMRYGILFVEERFVPVQRMQHVDLMRGPIERLFGLATLVVFTAGNEGSAFRVPGLSPARAEAMRDRILRMRGDDQL